MPTQALPIYERINTVLNDDGVRRRGGYGGNYGFWLSSCKLPDEARHFNPFKTNNSEKCTARFRTIVCINTRVAQTSMNRQVATLQAWNQATTCNSR